MPKYLKCGRFANDLTIFVFKDSKTRKKFINKITNDMYIDSKFKWYKNVGYSQLTYNQLQTLNYEYFDMGDE